MDWRATTTTRTSSTASHLTTASVSAVGNPHARHRPQVYIPPAADDAPRASHGRELGKNGKKVCKVSPTNLSVISCSPIQPVLQNHAMLSAPSSNMARRNRPSQKQRLSRALALERPGRSRSRGQERGRPIPIGAAAATTTTTGTQQAAPPPILPLGHAKGKGKTKGKGRGKGIHERLGRDDRSNGARAPTRRELERRERDRPCGSRDA
eukprot:6467966-Amphidinium_carterae.1